MVRLFLVRHGECGKNLLGIPGGPGAPLTEVGREQAIVAANEIKSYALAPKQIVACPTIQTVETANIIADELGISAIKNERLTSIYLGELAGIPIADARRLFPLSTESMDKWRRREVEICDVRVPGMEDPAAFLRRGIEYLLTCARSKKTEILVATTSILILVQNLSEMKGGERGEGYFAREYRNGQLIMIDLPCSTIEWLEKKAAKYGFTWTA